MCFQKELKQKEQELRRAKSSVLDISGEDEEVLLKRIEMTESAHKEERNKSNQLEDVRTVSSTTVLLFIVVAYTRKCEK